MLRPTRGARAAIAIFINDAPERVAYAALVRQGFGRKRQGGPIYDALPTGLVPCWGADGKVSGGRSTGIDGDRQCERSASPAVLADAAETYAKEGSRLKRAYVRLAVLSTSLMALLLAGGANIKRT
jgi:hypothetical protein